MNKIILALDTTKLEEAIDITKKIKDKINILLEKGNEQDLIESFHKKLEFGTGGMRGIIGIGSNKINKYLAKKFIKT